MCLNDDDFSRLFLYLRRQNSSKTKQKKFNLGTGWQNKKGDYIVIEKFIQKRYSFINVYVPNATALSSIRQRLTEPKEGVRHNYKNTEKFSISCRQSIVTILIGFVLFWEREREREREKEYKVRG